MSIFQKSVLQKHLNRLDKDKVAKAYKIFRANYSPEKIEQIKQLKEEEYQDGFLRDIFTDVLGYTLKPEEGYNLVREFKNQSDSKKADGAIVSNGVATAIIELKSTSTKDLTSVTQQAFNYKNNQPGCKYVITSNFQKLRFFIDYSNEYHEFDLFNLHKEKFEEFYLLLHKENIFSDLPRTMKKETRFHEQNISIQLYKDYSDFKYKIFDNLVKNNNGYNKITLFEKSQKLLDRLLFIFFAEDCGLLPANSILRIIDHYDKLAELDAYRPLYDTYKLYFGYMNTGRKGKTHSDDIPAYNGGLFAPDEILDSLVIDDDVLRSDSIKLSKYDFSTEVDVNILGHIFEHSLNEIEEFEKQLAENPETEAIKASKRKKDGVFYTPKYITQYIVENTLGRLCENKRKEMGIFEIEFSSTDRTKKGLSEKGKTIFNKLKEYKEWLKALKIIDPACGSGAFLNQALTFLIAEHKLIDDLIADLTSQAIRIFDTDKSILENNLFGVDINQESVEIAKLSLWLRTAQKERKLSDLNGNIKCGNSLVDNFAFNYRKAFDWKTEFADIFSNGGFDIVIGNPPYIKEYTNRKAFEGLHSHYCYQGKMDLWYFFGALALEIVKKQTGLIGYIAPNNWITNSGASKFRNIILQKGKLLEFIDFSDFKVFDSAGIQTMIYIMQRTEENNTYSFDYSKILDSKINHETNQQFLLKAEDSRFTYFVAKIDKSENINKPINFINASIGIVIDKIAAKQNFTLTEKEVANGIHPHHDYVKKNMLKTLGTDFSVGDGIFALSSSKIKDLNLNAKEKGLLKPYYFTSNFSKYFANPITDEFLIYTGSEFKNPKMIEPYPNLKLHIDKFKNVITSDNKPYGLHRARDERFFIGEKIIVQRKCAKHPIFTFSDFNCYVSATFNIIKTERLNLKYLTALLNSKLIAFWLKYKGKMQGDNYQIDKEPLLALPLLQPDSPKQMQLAQLTASIIENKEKELDYLALHKTAKDGNNFEREILLAKELERFKTDIELAEQKIDSLVYELYNLQGRDISTIENAIK
jgi:hypothetical protein